MNQETENVAGQEPETNAFTSKWKKAIIYFFCDFPTFKRKLKERFRRKKNK